MVWKFDTKSAQVGTQPVSLMLLFTWETLDAAFHIKRNISETGRVSTWVLCLCLQLSLLYFKRWPITVMTNTKRNIINKENLTNKKVLLTPKKGFAYIYKNPTANSHSKLSRQISTANSGGEFPRQKAGANTHGK